MEGELIDRVRILARVVLQRAGEKTLREEETRQPEGFRHSEFDPVIDEMRSQLQIFHPGGERFEGGVRGVRPHHGDLVVQETRVNEIQ